MSQTLSDLQRELGDKIEEIQDELCRLNAQTKHCFGHVVGTRILTVPGPKISVDVTAEVTRFMTYLMSADKCLNLVTKMDRLKNTPSLQVTKEFRDNRLKLYKSEIVKEVETAAMEAGFMYRPMSKRVVYLGDCWYSHVDTQLYDLAILACGSPKMISLCRSRRHLVEKIATIMSQNKKRPDRDILLDLFTQAKEGSLPKQYKNWEASDAKGRSVAHIYAIHHTPSPDFSAWGISTKTGWTVAHTAALYGHLPPGFSQWNLRLPTGETVADIHDRVRKFAKSELTNHTKERNHAHDRYRRNVAESAMR